MAINIGELNVKLTANVKAFQTAMTDVSQRVKGAAKTLESVNGAARTAALSFGAVGVAGTALLGKFANVASEVEETQNVLNETFGPENVQGVEDWANTFAEATGRSAKQAKEFAGGFNALLSPMLDSQEAANDMSTGLAQLSTDLGSFFNRADDDAMAALRSGIIGATEPLQSFGVDLRAAALNTFLLNKGIKTQFKDLTASEQAMVRYEAILAQTTKAQGDAARTADGFANSSKAVESSFTALFAAIGAQLLPIFSRLNLAIAAAVNFFAELPAPVLKFAAGTAVAVTAFAGLVAGIATFTAAAPAIIAAFGAMSAGLSIVSGAATAAGLAMLKAFVAALPVILPVGLAIGAVGLAWSAFSDAVDSGGLDISAAIQGVKETFETLVGSVELFGQIVMDSFEQSGMAIKGAFMTAVEFVGGLFESLTTDASGATSFIADAFLFITKPARAAVTGIATVFSKLFNFLRGQINSLTQGFAEFGQNINDFFIFAIGKALRQTDEQIQKTIEASRDLGEGLLSNAGGNLARAADSFVDKLKTGVQDVGMTFKRAFESTTKNTLKDLSLGGKALEVSGKKVENSGEALKKNFEDAADALGERLDDIDEKLSGAVAGFAVPGGGALSQPTVPETATETIKREAREAEDAADIASRQAARERYDNASTAVANSLRGVASSAGAVGRVINSAIEGFQQGGPIAALVNVLLELFLASEGFKNGMDIMNETFGKVVEALEPIFGLFERFAQRGLNQVTKELERFAPLIETIGDVLGALSDSFGEIADVVNNLTGEFDPLTLILKALGFVFRGIGIAVLEVAKVFADIANFFGGDVDKEAIQRRQDELINPELKKKREAAEKAAAKAAEEEAERRRALANAIGGRGGSFSNVLGDATDGLGDLADNTNKLNDSLANVPNVFKIAAARFGASEAGVGGQIGSTGIQGQGGQGNVRIDNVKIVSEDPERIWRGIRDRSRLQRIQENGVSIRPLTSASDL